MGALNVAARILAARLIVIMAVLGAIILAYPALDHPNEYQLIMLAIYCTGVVLPAVWLASRP